MSDHSRWMRLSAGALLSGVLVSSAALALPWDVDMVDSPAVRGYECWEYEVREVTDDDGTVRNERVCIRGMQPLPEGVISQPNLVSPTAYQTIALDKMDMDGWKQMESPLDMQDAKVLAKGETMFRTYCAPCHGVPDENGVIENLGTVAQPGRFAGVVMLSGEGGVLKNRTDGQVYRAIRMGNAIMPAYNWAMSDDEMWAIVAYSRTLEDSTYIPPEPPPAEDETTDEGAEQ